jgi:N utilization substance protein A
MIVDAIDVDETLAQLLVSEGFTSIEEIAGTDKTEFSSIEGFDEEIVDELINRSTLHLEKTEDENNKILSDLKVEDKFIEFWQLNSSMLVALAKNKIITLDDFAGLTTDDLIGYYEDKHDKNSRVSGMLDGFSLTRDEADQLILEARKIWLN